jgi:hypothetical protein
MSGDSDSVADESSSDDLADRDELADEAEAADEADLLDAEEAEETVAEDDDAAQAPAKQGAQFSWGRLLVAVLPVLALLLALGVGYL